MTWNDIAFSVPAPLSHVAVDGVRVHGKHGVFESEKAQGHDFLVDVDMRVDTRSAGRDDALERSVSYADAAAIVEEVVAGRSVDLIETLAERIAQCVLERHVLVREVSVSVHKPTAPIPQPFTDARVRLTRRAAPVSAFIALGSNLGDSEDFLSGALAALARVPETRLIAASRVFETDPVSDIDQDVYLNAAALLETSLSPWQLLDSLHEIENAARRTRTLRWGPRTLDLDLISWGQLTCDDERLTLPHPRAHERAFVLAPMLDIDPEWSFPDGRQASDLVKAAPDRAGLRPGPRVAGFASEARPRKGV